MKKSIAFFLVGLLFYGCSHKAPSLERIPRFDWLNTLAVVGNTEYSSLSGVADGFLCPVLARNVNSTVIRHRSGFGVPLIPFTVSSGILPGLSSDLRNITFQQKGNGSFVADDNGSFFPVPHLNWQQAILRKEKKLISKGASVVALEAPVYFSTTGNSPDFMEWFTQTKGAQSASRDSSVDSWFVWQKAKRELLNNSLDTLASSHVISDSTSLWLALPSGVQAAQCNIILPGTDRIFKKSISAILGLRTSLPDSPFVYQGVKQARPFASAYLDYSWLQNSVHFPQQTVFLCLEPYGAAGNVSDPGLLRSYQTQFLAAIMQDRASGYALNYRLTWDQIRSQPNIASFLGLVRFISQDIHKHWENQRTWLETPWPKTGVLFSDSYQLLRGGQGRCEMESFYQLALPLLYHGLPVAVVPLERIAERDYLRQFKVLFASYEAFKPLSAEYHYALKDWVENGGVLIFYLGATGAYDEIEEWWAKNYDRPHEHLFELLRTGLYPVSGMHKVEKGIVYVDHSSPAELALRPKSGELVWNTYLAVLTNYAGYDSSLFVRNDFLQTKQGPYLALFVREDAHESVKNVVRGNFLDLLTPEPVLCSEKILSAGEPALLYDLDLLPADTTALLIATGAVSDVEVTKDAFRCTVHWLPGTSGSLWLRLPNQPENITCFSGTSSAASYKTKWIASRNLLVITFTFPEQPLHIQISNSATIS